MDDLEDPGLRIEIVGPARALWRNPRLLWLLDWVADLSKLDALGVLEAYREGEEYPCEAVEKYGSTAALVQAAVEARKDYPVEMPRRIDWEAVDRLFAESNHQVDVVLGLYKMAYGPRHWPRVAAMDDYPGVCEEDNKKFMERMIRFDEKHHPETLPGSVWLRRGFRTVCSAACGFFYPEDALWEDE